VSRSKWDWPGDLQVFRGQAARVYSLIGRPGQVFGGSAVYRCRSRSRGGVRFVIGDALGDARCRGRVVHLVLGQDGAQMSLAEDQHAVEDFAAQGADEAQPSAPRSTSTGHPLRTAGSRATSLRLSPR
jgi:hypothetical protein